MDYRGFFVAYLLIIVLKTEDFQVAFVFPRIGFVSADHENNYHRKLLFLQYIQFHSSGGFIGTCSGTDQKPVETYT